MSDPTEAALKLADWFIDGYGLGHSPSAIPAVRAALAERIDKELLLPEKHAALLLAQSVVDAAVQSDWYQYIDDSSLDDLRTALAKLR